MKFVTSAAIMCCQLLVSVKSQGRNYYQEGDTIYGYQQANQDQIRPIRYNIPQRKEPQNPSQRQNLQVEPMVYNGPPIDRQKAQQIAQALQQNGGYIDEKRAQQIAQTYVGSNAVPPVNNNNYPPVKYPIPTTTSSSALTTSSSGPVLSTTTPSGAVVSMTQQRIKFLLGSRDVPIQPVVNNAANGWDIATTLPPLYPVDEFSTSSWWTDTPPTQQPVQAAFSSILDLLKPVMAEQGIVGVLQVLGDPIIFQQLGAAFVAQLIAALFASG